MSPSHGANGANGANGACSGSMEADVATRGTEQRLHSKATDQRTSFACLRDVVVVLRWRKLTVLSA